MFSVLGYHAETHVELKVRYAPLSILPMSRLLACAFSLVSLAPFNLELNHLFF